MTLAVRLKCRYEETRLSTTQDRDADFAPHDKERRNTIGDWLPPPLLLLAGYGVSYVDDRLARRLRVAFRPAVVALTYAALLICASVWVDQIQARSEPADWVGAAVFLDKTVVPGDVVLMPKINALLEYYLPWLAGFQAENLSQVYPAGTAAGRRIVVCYEGLWPDPCGAIQDAATHGSSWTSHHLNGSTIFVSGK